MEIPDFDEQQRRAEDVVNNLTSDIYAANKDQIVRAASWCVYWGTILKDYAKSPENEGINPLQQILEYTIRNEYYQLEIINQLRRIADGNAKPRQNRRSKSKDSKKDS